jgi:hypothetical protein
MRQYRWHTAFGLAAMLVVTSQCAGQDVAFSKPTEAVLVIPSGTPGGFAQVTGTVTSITSTGIQFQETGGTANKKYLWAQKGPIQMVRTGAADYRLINKSVTAQTPKSFGPDAEFRIIGPVAAKVTLANDKSADGIVASFTPTEIGFKTNDLNSLAFTYSAEQVKEVSLNGKRYQYDSKRRVMFVVPDPEPVSKTPSPDPSKPPETTNPPSPTPDAGKPPISTNSSDDKRPIEFVNRVKDFESEKEAIKKKADAALIVPRGKLLEKLRALEDVYRKAGKDEAALIKRRIKDIEDGRIQTEGLPRDAAKEIEDYVREAAAIKKKAEEETWVLQGKLIEDLNKLKEKLRQAHNDVAADAIRDYLAPLIGKGEPPREGIGPGNEPFQPLAVVLVLTAGQQRLGTVLGMNSQAVVFKGIDKAVTELVFWTDLRAVRAREVEYTRNASSNQIDMHKIPQGITLIIGPQNATITKVDGTQAKGTLVSLFGGELGWYTEDMSVPTTLTGATVRQIQIDQETYVYYGNTFVTKTQLQQYQQAAAAQERLMGWFCTAPFLLFGVAAAIRARVGYRCPECLRWGGFRTGSQHLGSGREGGTIYTRNGVETSRHGFESFSIYMDHYKCRHCPYNWGSESYKEHDNPFTLLFYFTCLPRRTFRAAVGLMGLVIFIVGSAAAKRKSSGSKPPE